MSLDVYLMSRETTKKECWHCGSEYEEHEEYFSANITHNLNTMADKAGIYKHLWRPEELQIECAKDLIDPLKKALKDMNERPEYYKQFNASNGWGLYKDFLPWIEDYLNACINNPNAIISVSR